MGGSDPFQDLNLDNASQCPSSTGVAGEEWKSAVQCERRAERVEHAKAPLGSECCGTHKGMPVEGNKFDPQNVERLDRSQILVLVQDALQKRLLRRTSACSIRVNSGVMSVISPARNRSRTR